MSVFKETRFISDRSLQMKDSLNGRHGGLDDGKKTLYRNSLKFQDLDQSALSNACALHASIQEDNFSRIRALSFGELVE